MNTLARAVVATAGAGALTLGYAAGIERNRFVLRQATVPVLAEGAAPFRILHISDMHMTPDQRRKQRWVAALAELAPDLVVDTGDNLAHAKAVPGALRALQPLLAFPGVFVFGSNDYYAPKPKNVASYLWKSKKRVKGGKLPWRDLRAVMIEHGWQDLTNTRSTVQVGGRTIALAGVDDPHLRRDRYDSIAGTADPDADLRLALVHAPEPRVLDRFEADGYDLILCGHTHGGQLRVPGAGALVTNCGLERSRARGASQWGPNTWLHVSAGLGTSPFAPVRFACPPEASLLTLVPRGDGARATGARSVAAVDVG